MPERDDGMPDSRELGGTLVETLVNGTAAAQAGMLCEGGSSRNGCRERKLAAGVGEIAMKIPESRMGGCFPDDAVERHSRAGRAVAAAASGMHAAGASAGKIEKAAAKPGAGKMSAGQAGRICEALDEEAAGLRHRTFGDIGLPCLRIDAACTEARGNGRASSTAAVTAIGCGEGGTRRFVGFDCVGAESCASWKGFPEGPRSRGAADAHRVASDAHEGSRKAISERFPGAARRRRIVRLERNARSLLETRRYRAMAGKAMRAVFGESGPVVAREAYRVAIGGIGKLGTAAAGLLEEAEADASACLDSPTGHRRRLRADNARERADRGTKRRSRVVQVFPSAKPLVRSVGAACCEIDEDRSSRCCIAPDSSAVLKEAERAGNAAEATEEGRRRAARSIAVAMGSAERKRRAAWQCYDAEAMILGR